MITSSQPFEYDSASFKDPSGRVFYYENSVYRELTERSFSTTRTFLNLVNKGVFNNLVYGSLIDTHIVDVPETLASQFSIPFLLQHRRLPHITYSYEWTLSQLHQAALFTLELELKLLELGFTLKDASPFNLIFENGKPIFIDFHSIEPNQSESGWLALSEFLEFFLYPLLIAKELGLDHFRYWIGNLGRIPLADAARILRSAPFWSASIFKYVRLPVFISWLIAKTKMEKIESKIKISIATTQINLHSLFKTIVKLKPAQHHSAWSNYTTDCHYSKKALNEKKQFIEQALRSLADKKTNLKTGLDIGANTGEYSFLLSHFTESIIAIESDPKSADLIYQRARLENLDIHPIVCDFTALTPALGWAHQERKSFLARWEGKVDITLALAVIHHLRITSNVPLAMILHQLAAFSSRLIIEWVNLDDPMCKQLIANKKLSPEQNRTLYTDYHFENFKTLLEKRFQILDSCSLDNGRIIFVLARKA